MLIKWPLMTGFAFVLLIQQSESVPVETSTQNDTNLTFTSDISNHSNETTVSTMDIAGKSSDSSIDTNSTTTKSSSRRGRIMDFSKILSLFKPTEEDWKELTAPVRRPLFGNSQSNSKPIQSRILTGGASLEELADNTFSSVINTNKPKLFVNDKYDASLTNVQSSSLSSIKTYQPSDRFASALSYSNPSVKSDGVSGHETSDLAPYYQSGGASYSRGGSSNSPVLYKLVPVNPSTQMSYTFSDAVKDTILSVGGKVKDHVSGTVQKVKSALGWNGFSEKVASPDALLAVAPVAAGLLAGGLAVAYLASKAGPKNNASMPFNFFGKRSVRNAMSEDDLQHIVARLDPVQREYLQKLQMYGPQRWKDVTCAKYIFCDVMSRATPLHVRDMQRKIGVFLSRMEETTARYVEVILKDVMLAIQARDCSRFSCSQTTWGLPQPPPPPPQSPPQILHPFQFLPGNNFLRRQREKN